MKTPISAVDAIKFAVEKIDDGTAMDFLNSWLHGDWQYLRENWPEAFAAQALPDDHARAVAAVIAMQDKRARRLLLWVAGVALLGFLGAVLMDGVL